MFLDKIVVKYNIASHVVASPDYDSHLHNVRMYKQTFRTRLCAFINSNIENKEIGGKNYAYLRAICNYADIDKLLMLKQLMYKSKISEFVKQLEATVS